MVTHTTLVPNAGSTHRRLRLGRGVGSGRGGTSGRGNKGQNARSGAKRYPTFEGGQTPLFRRIPKKRGFTAWKQVRYLPINLSILAKLAESGVTDFDTDILFQHGIVRRKGEKIKILGNEKLSTALTIRATACSAGARASIEQAGGSVIVPEKAE